MTPNIISHYLTTQYVRDIEGWSGKAGQRSRITFRTSCLYAHILDSFICDIIGLTKLQKVRIKLWKPELKPKLQRISPTISRLLRGCAELIVDVRVVGN